MTSIKAYLQRAGDDGFPFEGHLDYYDPEVDQSTGTLAMRAIFDNQDHRILPGFFVRVQVPIGQLKEALLVPEKALTRDQAGTYVLVVVDGNLVERRNVTVGPKQGDMIVIDDGLRPDESVIVVGLQRARPGSEVDPKDMSVTDPDQSEDSSATN